MNPQTETEICPTCGVTIYKSPSGDAVEYAVGPNRDRGDLAQRICSLVPTDRYEKRAGCINKDERAKVTEPGMPGWRRYNFDVNPKANADKSI